MKARMGMRMKKTNNWISVWTSLVEAREKREVTGKRREENPSENCEYLQVDMIEFIDLE
jgi:hypothetical protein